MAVLPKCPSCGLESGELRCPRCNTLKVIGCTGSCTLCGDKSACAPTPEPASPSETDAGSARSKLRLPKSR